MNTEQQVRPWEVSCFGFMAMKEGQGMLQLLFEQRTGKCVGREHFPTIFLGATMCLIRQMSSLKGPKYITATRLAGYYPP